MYRLAILAAAAMVAVTAPVAVAQVPDPIFADGFDPFRLTTVAQVQRGLATGSVSLRGVVVTARARDLKSLWVMDPTGPGAYNGIYVFRGSAQPPLDAGIVIGSTVDLTGTTMEFDPTPPFEPLTEILGGTVTLVGAGSFEPLVGVGAGTLASLSMGEPYEGVLVTLENLDVVAIDTNFDLVTLREVATGATIVMDDFILDFNDPDYPIGTNFSSVTGVMHVAFDQRYVLPRDEADLSP
jgi:hypothetical protein